MEKKEHKSLDFFSFYDEKERFNISDSLMKADKIIDFLKRNKIVPKTIIELGCGVGLILREIYTYFNENNYGVGMDISRRAIVKAKDLNPTLNFIIADATKVPFKDLSFDLCLLVDIIEHIPDPQEILEEATRISRCVLLKVPLEYNYWRRFLNMTGIFTWEDSRNTVGHLHWWNYGDVKKLLKDYNILCEELILLLSSHTGQISLLGLAEKFIGLLRKLSFKLLPRRLYMKIWGGDLLIMFKRELR